MLSILLSIAMTLKDLTPTAGQRGFLVGLSGSGKTELGKHLLYHSRNVIVVDSKNEFPTDGYFVVNDPSKLKKIVRYPILYRPRIELFDSVPAYNEFFKIVFERGNVTLLVDEIAAFTTANRYPHYMKAVYQQGRSKGITTIGCTQRPSAIPSFTYTESTRFYAFALNSPDDRKKVASVIRGLRPDDLQASLSDDDSQGLPRFYFYYYDSLSGSRAIRQVLPDPKIRRQEVKTA